MTPLSLDEMRDLVPGYVMGTLTPHELRVFDVTMRDTAIAAQLTPEIDASRAAIEFLATERAVAPPAGLRDRVLSRIASEPPQPAADTNVVARDDNASPPKLSLLPNDAPRADTNAASTSGSREPRRDDIALRVSGEQPASESGRRATRATPPFGTRVVPASRASWWIAGVLGAALAASAAFAVNMNGKLLGIQNELAESRRAVQSSAIKLAESEATLKSLLDGGSDLVLVRLVANESPEPGMQVFWNKKKGTAVVLATGLKPVAADRAYCLWMIKDGAPVAVKLFNVDGDGRAVVSGVVVPTSAEGVAAFAVTEEPAAGSPQPTMTPFLVGNVPTTATPAAPKE